MGVILTQSLNKWLFDNHSDKLALIYLGHTELLTKEMYREYIEWCKTDEGRQYLKGGSKYVPDPRVEAAMCPENSPTADVTNAVRCRDCKYNVANQEPDPCDATDYTDIVCTYHMSDGFDPEDFCSKGELNEPCVANTHIL